MCSSDLKGFIGDAFDTNVEIVENGVHYMIDVANGQKTGFFLDQKYNRLAMQRICKGKKVLDCFTHMGTFALNAGIAGAADVTGLDISEYAVSQAEANARLNHLENTVHFRQANVLDELPKLAQAGEKYDVVILDPPAFTKSREATFCIKWHAFHFKTGFNTAYSSINCHTCILSPFPFIERHLYFYSIPQNSTSILQISVL